MTKEEFDISMPAVGPDQSHYDRVSRNSRKLLFYGELRNNFVLGHKVNSFEYVSHLSTQTRYKSPKYWFSDANKRNNFNLVHFHTVELFGLWRILQLCRSVTRCVSHFGFHLQRPHRESQKKSFEQPKTFPPIISTIINYYQHGNLNVPHYK